MEKNIKGLKTCVACGRDFPLIFEAHYISKDPGKTGLSALAGGDEPALYDTFDCPHCGCQNRIQKRNRVYSEEDCPCPDEDDPVCPYPKGGECYCKDTCSPECEFHPEHREDNKDGVQ